MYRNKNSGTEINSHLAKRSQHVVQVVLVNKPVPVLLTESARKLVNLTTGRILVNLSNMSNTRKLIYRSNTHKFINS